MIMKKILIFTMMLILSAACYAQKDVTKFLGIPVDGSSVKMVERLKAKGFKRARNTGGYATLRGEFNGYRVLLTIVTNRNKVSRIMVSNLTSYNEGNVKIQFNNLCQQFINNPKYIAPADYAISDDEDIMIGVMTGSKMYDAVFYQVPSSEDSAEVRKNFISSYASLYSAEELNSSSLKEFINTNVNAQLLEKAHKKPVWFRIVSDGLMGYNIIIYYDNEYNRAQGSDL